MVCLLVNVPPPVMKLAVLFDIVTVPVPLSVVAPSMTNCVVLPLEFKFRAPLLRMLPPLWMVSGVLFPILRMSEAKLISRLRVVSPLVAVMLTVELATLMHAFEVAPGTPADQLPAVSQLPVPPFQL